MILILVMAFFMLGCRFSCSGMKEDFNATEATCTMAAVGCNLYKINRCLYGGFSSKVSCAKCNCGWKKGVHCTQCR